MVVTSRRIPNPELPEEEKQKLLKQPKYKSEGISETQPFMFLSLDLPAKPLFVDPHKQIAIPQVKLGRKNTVHRPFIFTRLMLTLLRPRDSLMLKYSRRMLYRALC